MKIQTVLEELLDIRHTFNLVIVEFVTEPFSYKAGGVVIQLVNNFPDFVSPPKLWKGVIFHSIHLEDIMVKDFNVSGNQKYIRFSSIYISKDTLKELKKRRWFIHRKYANRKYLEEVKSDIRTIKPVHFESLFLGDDIETISRAGGGDN